MESKTQFYHRTGDTRDLYISVNSGGFFAPTSAMPEVPVSTFHTRRLVQPSHSGSPQRTVRYRTNGSGRDLYISTNAGGFEQSSWKMSPNATFYQSLRNSQDLLRTGALVCSQTRWLPARHQSALRLRSSHQKLLVERLARPRQPSPIHSKAESCMLGIMAKSAERVRSEGATERCKCWTKMKSCCCFLLMMPKFRSHAKVKPSDLPGALSRHMMRPQLTQSMKGVQRSFSKESFLKLKKELFTIGGDTKKSENSQNVTQVVQDCGSIALQCCT